MLNGYTYSSVFCGLIINQLFKGSCAQIACISTQGNIYNFTCWGMLYITLNTKFLGENHIFDVVLRIC